MIDPRETAGAKLAGAGRQNADAIGVGLPALLMIAAEQWLGVEIPMEFAVLAAGLLGSWGAKIKRAL